MTTDLALRQLTRALWATLCCFALGTVAGVIALWGTTRPFTGEGAFTIPTALIAATIAAATFVVSTLMHRRRETKPMPRWQAAVSHFSSLAVTMALGAVTGLGVMLAAQVLALGLEGLEVNALGGGIMIGVASALGGRLSFQAGISLNARDLAALLFSFLIIGTVFAMLTEAEPSWWERNFSQLGISPQGWAFNGTLIIAGLLVATIGAYIGRDLHRLLDDGALPNIAVVVILWLVAGVSLAGVGLLPLDQRPVSHTIVAFLALIVLVAAAAYTQVVVPKPPTVLRLATATMIILTAVATATTFLSSLMSVTALEGVVVGLALLWMNTLVRVLSILVPETTLVSKKRQIIRSKPRRKKASSRSPRR